MKVIDKAIVRNHAGAALVLFAFLAATTGRAGAKPRAVKAASEPVSVIAHLELSGNSVRQLILQKSGNKQYLYIEQASKEGFAIVDVTSPSQPNVIKREASPNELPIGRLQMVGGQVALAAAADTSATELVPRTETVKVLDLSDSANPRTVLSFAGVTGTVEDEARNLVYITNNDGLWILKYQPARATPSASARCLSEDASNELASCQ